MAKEASIPVPQASVTHTLSQRLTAVPSLPMSSSTVEWGRKGIVTDGKSPGPSQTAQSVPHLQQTCLGLLFDANVNVVRESPVVVTRTVSFSWEGWEEICKSLRIAKIPPSH